MLYRKKPIVIEAFRFTTDSDGIAPDWFTQAVVDRTTYLGAVRQTAAGA